MRASSVSVRLGLCIGLIGARIGRERGRRKRGGGRNMILGRANGTICRGVHCTGATPWSLRGAVFSGEYSARARLWRGTNRALIGKGRARRFFLDSVGLSFFARVEEDHDRLCIVCTRVCGFFRALPSHLASLVVFNGIWGFVR